ncbi:HD domain-containing protein [Lipomyces japonicus]|uniref:HD domain-containing protein n=1 Tax=Lipomyces japonicus TaxID=56871 RepID=UPI0034CD402E
MAQKLEYSHGEPTGLKEATRLWTPGDIIPQSILELPTPLLFFRLLRFLKTTKRQGWLDRGIQAQNTESISDHMYRMAAMSLLAPEEVDSRKCVAIAIVHDLAEAVVGDITPHDDVTPEEKHRRERETIEFISESLQPVNAKAAAEITSLYLEYEHESTAEARFVKDLDKLEFILQTIEYQEDVDQGKEDQSIRLNDFLNARHKIKHTVVQQWTDQVLQQREKAKDKVELYYLK